MTDQEYDTLCSKFEQLFEKHILPGKISDASRRKLQEEWQQELDKAGVSYDAWVKEIDKRIEPESAFIPIILEPTVNC